MAQVLRQSTQVVVHVGPFVDVTDGFTPETGITLGAADEAEALKGGATTTTDISAATWAAITGCDGWYALTLTTSHTDTIGTLTVVVHDDSVCLPVFARFQVIEEAAYDACYAASAAPATAAGVSAVETDTQDLQARLPAALVSGRVDASVGAMAANVVTAAAVAADAGTEIAAAVWASATRELTASLDPTAAAMADAVWDEDATGHQTQGTFGQALGDPGADANTIYQAVVTDATGATVGVDVAAVLVDTAEIGVAGAGLTAINLPNQTMDITGNLSGSVGSVTGAVGSVTGAVGSVTGAVGSVTGAVGSVTAAVTVGTNTDKTGYSLTQTFPANFATLAIDASGNLTNQALKKNTAVTSFTFAMLDSTDHVTPMTGLTITAQRSLDGAAFAACANSATELANGCYAINLATTDLNANVVTLRFTATGADPTLITLVMAP